MTAGSSNRTPGPNTMTPAISTAAIAARAAAPRAAYGLGRDVDGVNNVRALVMLVCAMELPRTDEAGSGGFG
ncbi:hypothetical protein GCM10007859_04060 [Brevundimonas denitrificans]|uniref:Uncharacterized protein n=1 Tax=Brevundimonas denitrificans TaxID=1443434 RepID=A0ABQ6BIR7_9CAUL|nr:hypothetical protein GCM10007859_04060 [Brevundimonas denitrificans]